MKTSALIAGLGLVTGLLAFAFVRSSSRPPQHHKSDGSWTERISPTNPLSTNGAPPGQRLAFIVHRGTNVPHNRVAQGIDPTGLVDWGLVELSVNTPKRLSLGEGKDCTLTVVSADHGQLQVKIETREKLAGGDLPPGVPPGTPVESIKTVTTTLFSNVEVVMSAGQRPVRFTPILKGL